MYLNIGGVEKTMLIIVCTILRLFRLQQTNKGMSVVFAKTCMHNDSSSAVEAYA